MAAKKNTGPRLSRVERLQKELEEARVAAEAKKQEREAKEQEQAERKLNTLRKRYAAAAKQIGDGQSKLNAAIAAAGELGYSEDQLTAADTSESDDEG